MPYIYVEELQEGQQEANVIERDIADAVANERDELKGQVETLSSTNEGLISERDSLAKELDNAKVKFANAFLSSSQHIKEVQKKDAAKDSSVKSFSQLFSERNEFNAN